MCTCLGECWPRVCRCPRTHSPLDLELQVSEPSYIGAGNPINALEEQQDTLRYGSLFSDLLEVSKS